MFKENKKHIQKSLFGFDYYLTKKKYAKLMESEEYTFYKLIFCNIDEKQFSVLYSDKKSRPNSPVNVMLSALILKEKRGWSYKALLDKIDFDIKTRAALGLHDFSEAPFTEPTIFDFQNRINDYQVKHGVNLIEQVFDGLTASQLKALKIKTDIQRSDSFLVASNIRKYSRLGLLIEVILRFYRILSEDDKKRSISLIGEYLEKGSSERYCYDLSRNDLPKEFDRIGQIYQKLIDLFGDKYGDTEIYQIVERVFEEQFTVSKEEVLLKPPEELSSGILQSPDDIEATYRKKRDQESHGRLVNISETANPENEINLIADVCSAANNKDESEVLNKRIDKIKEKTDDLDEMHTDGGYGSKANDLKMEELGIRHIQTAVRGRSAKVPINIKKKDGHYDVSCPLQKVKSGFARKRNKALFDNKICSECSLQNECPTILQKQKNGRVYYFTEEDYLQNRRKMRILEIPPERRKIRPNVEATVREFRNNMNHKGKLKVRGTFKTDIWAYTMAISINFGRIYRYISDNSVNFSVELSFLSFFKELVNIVSALSGKIRYFLSACCNIVSFSKKYSLC